jgi:hypothetical protein
MEFVEQLAAELEVVGVRPMTGRDCISGGEDWNQQIGGLIAESDSVIFTITPESAASEICEWEIAGSEQLGKRLIMVEFGGILTGDRQGVMVYAANGVEIACKNFQERLDAELSKSSPL